VGTSARPFRTASTSGLVAVVVYVAATVVGGLFHPGYSHVRDAISELTASHAAHRAPLAVLYVAYNLLLVGFAWGLVRPGSASRLLRWASGLVAVGSAAGIGQVTLFPQDSTGSPATARGAVHIALAGVSALLCVVTALMYGSAFRRMRLPRAAWLPAFAVAAFLVLTGPAAAASAGGPLMGLFERFTIGGYLVWVAVTCLVLSRVSTPAGSPGSESGLGAGFTQGPGSGPLHGARPEPAGAPRAR
jgi:Protein of unknown function (DUF998)